MSGIALRMGPLTADGYIIQRSGIRWLKQNGQYCRAGELIAYCNIGLVYSGTRGKEPPPFSDEGREFQVGFATKIGGRLCHSSGTSLGGFLDIHEFYQEWTPDFVLGQIEPDAREMIAPEEDPKILQLFMFAGRRASPLAEVRTGLMCGWHNRSRVWSGEGLEPHGTLLSLGICEQVGVVRGEQSAFLEFLEGICGPAHIVHVPDHLVVPSACLLLEQMKRSAAQFEEIAADIAHSLNGLGTAPMPNDWLFVGSLLASLQQTTLGDGYDLLTRSGLSRTGPADAVLLSINSESSVILRHKRLGYSLTCHDYRFMEAEPAVRSWLRTAFERVKRTPEMIRLDLRDLVNAVREKAETEILIMNGMSTSGHEDVFNYSPFDRPMGDVLKTHYIKEMNLMLQDLSRECDLLIVDTDAIAADLGAEAHLPDGMHQSGPLQAEIRQEIIHLLAARGVPGFAPATVK
jgi:hypothetical protein